MMENVAVQVQGAQIADLTRFRRCLEEGCNKEEARRQAMSGFEPEARIAQDQEAYEQELRLKRALQEEQKRIREEYDVWADTPEGRRFRLRESFAWVMDILATVGVAAMALALLLQVW